MMYKDGNWEFTWQQLDPEEAFQIQHKLSFHSGPLSPCSTQAGEQSCAISGGVLWGGIPARQRLVLIRAEEIVL